MQQNLYKKLHINTNDKFVGLQEVTNFKIGYIGLDNNVKFNLSLILPNILSLNNEYFMQIKEILNNIVVQEKYANGYFINNNEFELRFNANNDILHILLHEIHVKLDKNALYFFEIYGCKKFFNSSTSLKDCIDKFVHYIDFKYMNVFVDICMNVNSSCNDLLMLKENIVNVQGLKLKSFAPFSVNNNILHNIENVNGHTKIVNAANTKMIIKCNDFLKFNYYNSILKNLLNEWDLSNHIQKL